MHINFFNDRCRYRLQCVNEQQSGYEIDNNVFRNKVNHTYSVFPSIVAILNEPVYSNGGCMVVPLPTTFYYFLLA